MKRLALGVAALLVVSAGSVATAAPSGEPDGGSWCDNNSDAKAQPEVEKEKPVTAGGGQRDGRTPNAFTCSEAEAEAGGEEVSVGTVVNAWVDHENGVVRVTCVPGRRSTVARSCNQIVPLPARAEVSVPGVDVTRPSEEERARVEVDDDNERPTLTIGVEELTTSVDVVPVCAELDRSPVCQENLGGE